MTHWTTSPRKQLGQHFLQDAGILSEIVRTAQLKPSDRVVEIGPGRGALTLPLLRQLEQLTVIELDDDLAAHWSQHDPKRLIVLHADALTIDYSQWGSGLHVIGNLPYNISTPLLIHLLKYRTAIHSIHVMLQKEVVDRIIAQPGTKNYGRLAVMMQAFCEVKWICDVPPEAFYPPPKVMSSVVSLFPRASQPKIELGVLEKVVAQAFAMRRKTIANNLKRHYNLQALETWGLNVKARPEQISVGEYIALARMINSS